MARPPAYAVLAVSTLAVQAAAAVLVVWGYGAAFGRAPWLAERTAVSLSYVLLGVAGLGAGSLALSGAYLAILRARPRVAVAVVALLTIPSIAVAVVALYGLLVLLAVV